MLSVNLSNIAISKIQGADYCVIISGISKSEAANLPQADLNKNSTILEVVKIIKKVQSISKKDKKYKVWWYWNSNTQISPTQKVYFDQ